MRSAGALVCLAMVFLGCRSPAKQQEGYLQLRGSNLSLDASGVKVARVKLDNTGAKTYREVEVRIQAFTADGDSKATFVGRVEDVVPGQNRLVQIQVSSDTTTFKVLSIDGTP